MPKFEKISPNIQRVIINNVNNKTKELEWINIIDAGKKELEFLKKKYGFSMQHISMASGKAMAQRPLVMKGDDYIFVILQYPVSRGKYIACGEIDFFVGKDYIVTLHNNNINALSNFFNRCKKDGGDSLRAYQDESSMVLLYEIMEKLMEESFEMLDNNSAEISKIEEMIFDQENQKHAISHILTMRRNITNFRKVMQSHKNVLKQLIESNHDFLVNDQIRSYYRNLIEYSKRLWEFSENQKEMIEIFYDTNESLINNQLSEIMKTLTIFSVLVFPLTLLAAIFGMNTTEGMPFMNTHYGFWIIIAIMFTGSLFMLLFFEKKKWL